jgi:entericidin B
MVELISLTSAFFVARKRKVEGSRASVRADAPPGCLHQPLFEQRSFHMGKHLIMVLLSLLVLSGTTSLLGACNTTAGAGEDLSDAGHAITGSAERNK